MRAVYIKLIRENAVEMPCQELLKIIFEQAFCILFFLSRKF